MDPIETPGRSYFDFEPARALAGFTTFGAAVIAAGPFLFGWSGEQTGVMSGLFMAFLAFIGNFIVRGKVTPNVNVAKQVHNTIVALSPLADGAGVVTPVAEPLRDTPVDEGAGSSGTLVNVLIILAIIVCAVWLVRAL